jgi:hypothetical protein
MAKSSKAPSSHAELWARLLEMADEQLTADAARYILDLHFPAEDVARMHQLAERAREGTLSSDEHADLNMYEQVGHVLSLMKSKARRVVERPARRRK